MNAARRAERVDDDHLAEVIPIASRRKPPPQLPSKARSYPPRRGRNGHIADCPYPHQYDPATCPCCQGEARGRKDDQ